MSPGYKKKPIGQALAPYPVGQVVVRSTSLSLAHSLWYFLLYSSSRLLSTGDQVQDLLGKGDHDTACDGQHAVGTLRGVVRFQGQTELQDTESEQDDTDGADQSEDEVAEFVDDRNRVIAICKRRGREDKSQHDCAEDAEQHAGSFGEFHNLGFMKAK